MKGSLTATTLTAPCLTLRECLADVWRSEVLRTWEHVRIAEDDTANATKAVNANKSFRHGYKVIECLLGVLD